MEKIRLAPEKDVFDIMREAIVQTAKDLEAQGVPPIKHGNPTLSTQGEATEGEIEAIESFFTNL